MSGRVLVVVTERSDAAGFADALVSTAQGYIEDAAGAAADVRTLVVNMCRSMGYGSDGYYVSLLADARGQRVLPRLETSAGLAEPYSRFRALQEAGIATLDAAEMIVRHRAAGLPPEPGDWPLVREGRGFRAAAADEVVDLIVCLGTTTDPRFEALAGRVFRVWPAPLLCLRVVRDAGDWKVADVAHAAPTQLDDVQRARLVGALQDDARALRRRTVAPRDTVRASIAVLLDTADPFCASSGDTIDRLERVAARMNVHIARVGASDLRRLPEYDALFIRSLTGVKQPSFQFALRAEALDMPVIDDPQSIIRCSNKVFLEELLRRERVPLPRTRIVTAHTPWRDVSELGLPFVIKSPDGSFSAGVHRIDSHEDYETRAGELLQHSPLLIAQEWLPTDFDWRVAVLDGELLFAARYYMARGHWQIRSEVGGVERYGRVEAVPRRDAPRAVVDAALAAARLIGTGLYGVDLKETAGGPVIIEVNDNPNLDARYEDAADGDLIYEDIVRYFVRRIEEAEAPLRAAEITRRGRGRGATRRAAGPAASDPGNGGRMPATRTPAARAATAPAPRYGLFEVAGLELEYPTVDAELNVVSLVEPAFRAIAGRGTSDIELEGVGFSNEIADHVFEVKTLEPQHSLRDVEDALVGGVHRFTEVLQQEWDARLLPTGMHPWFNPRSARLWTRSGLRIYTTYAQIFDIRTHGWMNVHATHVNLPFGEERETVAMHNAAAMLLPYLPALAASTPVHDGALQPFADARLTWILQHQARIPQTCGRMVPEFVASLADYRRCILQPMYDALDEFPHSDPIRHEFLNARGAVLRFARRALELRVLDTQECVHMDVALAAFTRSALRQLTAELLAGRLQPPSHDALVEDFEACVRDGSAAIVRAPHIVGECEDACVGVASVLRALLDRAHGAATADEAGYLHRIEDVIAQGSLSERIRARLAGTDTESLPSELRRVYAELADCLVRNEPWGGRSG